MAIEYKNIKVEVLILSKNNQITGFLGLGEILHYIFC